MAGDGGDASAAAAILSAAETRPGVWRVPARGHFRHLERFGRAAPSRPRSLPARALPPRPPLTFVCPRPAPRPRCTPAVSLRTPRSPSPLPAIYRHRPRSPCTAAAAGPWPQCRSRSARRQHRRSLSAGHALGRAENSGKAAREPFGFPSPQHLFLCCQALDCFIPR